MRSVKGILACLLGVLCIFLSSVPHYAAEGITEADTLIDGIISYEQKKASADSVQAWINSSLAKNAGSSSEWYVITLSQYGKYDFSAYTDSLLKYLANNKTASAVTRQKYALALIACGSTDSYIYNVLCDSIGKQGVMSYIYGLHLLNNGYSSPEADSDSVIKKLISLQLSDGGWSVMKSASSDVDATAMAIQALAPHYKADKNVAAAVNKALTLLSGRQLENGEFSSYGVSNAESTAQVLTALSSLGIDCASDSRFIKNGNTVISGLKAFRLSDGSFCHKISGGTNSVATVQSLYSLVAYQRMRVGKTPLYLLDARNPSGLKIPADSKNNTSLAQSSASSSATGSGTVSEKAPSKADKTESTQTSSGASHGAGSSEKSSAVQSAPSSGETKAESTDSTFTENGMESDENTVSADTEVSSVIASAASKAVGYKFPVCMAILLAAAVVSTVLYLLKKRSLKNFVVILLAAAVAVSFVALTDFQTVEGHYSGSYTDKSDIIGTVSLTIRCDTLKGEESEYIPKDGIILGTCQLEISKGVSVREALLQATAENKIHLEISGSDSGAYVKGIGNIYEFNYGDLSGWMYLVNGEAPSVSCGEYILSDGDSIEWLYTRNIGQDLN